MEHRLNEKWIKASIIGTIWAASEIVLGSFLHNLRVPFSGNILTAIGIIILISISYLWTEKGLFWRAGLICAVMKTMSPSAVIFGPMIAIFTESLLMEMFVRLLGRTISGYTIGAMMAMSWNLVQKILNYIIFYGSNIVEVYSNLLKYAQKQLNIQTDIVWLPIIFLLVAYALFGFLAAVVGIRVGRKMLHEPVSDLTVNYNLASGEVRHGSAKEFNYSIAWLFINVGLLILSLILLNWTSWFVWISGISAIVLIWSIRYKRALHQLSKPGFWILFILITLITAFVFTRIQTGENSLQTGLLTGLQMNFRAAAIIVGFAVLGTELYNPVVRNFFLKTSFKNLPMALELSAESLPLFIAGIPDLKTIVRNPVSIFYQVISNADRRLSEIKKKSSLSHKIFIITGSVGEGKTTFLRNLIPVFKQNNIGVGGILSQRKMTGSRTTGYDIVNIETGKMESFLSEDTNSRGETIGRFTISGKGLETGIAVLNSLIPATNRVIIIDE